MQPGMHHNAMPNSLHLILILYSRILLLKALYSCYLIKSYQIMLSAMLDGNERLHKWT